MVHSRFSTNTFPSWSRAHPYRYISHNGEINTLRGNINWMHARQSMMRSSLFGEDLQKILTVVDTEGSDSAMFDNVLELLTLSGRELPHAMMMMVPEPWNRHESMSPAKRAFYEYHSCLMEPWDGPASIAFTDGVRVGAVLDRNGLRPSRYYVTKDDLVVMASEVGVLDIPPDRIVAKGRLQPGRMFLVDTSEERIVADDELKERIAKQHPYREWLERYSVPLDELPSRRAVIAPDHETVLRRQEVFGYTAEDVKILITPMAIERHRAHRLDGQRHAARGALREAAAALRLLQAALRAGDEPAGRRDPRGDHHGGRDRRRAGGEPPRADAGVLPPARAAHAGAAQRGAREDPRARRRPGLEGAAQASRCRSSSARRTAAPGCARRSRTCAGRRPSASPRATTSSSSPTAGTTRRTRRSRRSSRSPAVHHHLIREGTRTRIGLVLETGEPREVHHFCAARRLRRVAR